ncbi:MAG TPA: hypothetical protein VKC57_02830 [Ktedonobacterales bacterium]|nr:hypothetical protein [Ktedonobacterales bacterium]
MEALDARGELSADDLALLRRFEPILCFNVGEQFFPMDADRFLAGSRLCAQRPGKEPEELVPRGQLDASSLARSPLADTPGVITFLSFASPLTATQVRAFHKSSTLKDFHTGPGRLVRVGLLPRIIDLLFSLSLLLRGRAPGGLAAGAAVQYQQLQAREERYSYYGRVVREHGFIALQYWFFYAFNDWRSSFHGVNDHEGDWEMLTVYAAEDARGAIEPSWIACSEHESDGDDLRRRWDDPDLRRIGEHPVIYPGAGSHANYFFRGEYMPAVVVPHTQGLARLSVGLRRVWARLGQGPEPAEREAEGLRIPFVDYARGDGLRIGPEQQHTWDQRLLQKSPQAPAPAWVEAYSGLWGLYSGDPLGENAPPGPRYERDGLQRKRWYDPVGWSGLDKVAPPARTAATLAEQQRRLRVEHDELTAQIEERASVLAGLDLEVAAMRTVPAERPRSVALQQRVHDVGADLERRKAERAENEIAQARCAALARHVAAGDFGDPRGHLRRPSLPTTPADVRLGRLAGVWSAVSVGVLLLGFAALAYFSGYLAPGIVVLLGVYGFFEALFHRDFQVWTARLVVALALLTTLVLLVRFFQPVLLGAVVLMGLFIIVENIREVLA